MEELVHHQLSRQLTPAKFHELKKPTQVRELGRVMRESYKSSTQIETAATKADGEACRPRRSGNTWSPAGILPLYKATVWPNPG